MMEHRHHDDEREAESHRRRWRHRSSTFFRRLPASFPEPSSFFDENIWKRTSSASRLNVAASSGESRIPSTVASFGQLGTTGTPFVAWLASGLCEARLGDTSTNSLVNSWCLTETGAGEAEPETRGPSATGNMMLRGQRNAHAALESRRGDDRLPMLPIHYDFTGEGLSECFAIPIDEIILLLNERLVRVRLKPKLAACPPRIPVVHCGQRIGRAVLESCRRNERLPMLPIHCG